MPCYVKFRQNETMKKRAVIVAATGIAIIVILLLLIVFILPHSMPVPAPASSQIRLAAPGLEQNALIYVAMDQGFFEKDGVNVSVRDDYPTGVGPVQDMSKGNYDLSVSAEYPAIVQIFSGSNISIIAMIDKYQNEVLISRRDFGIKNISDLKGKKIGLPRGTILEFFLGRFLELNGLGLKDVTLVDVNTSHAVDAIANGEVDAVMTFQPHTSRVLDRLGDNAIAWPGQSNQSLYGVVSARNDWIANHPDQIRRFLKSLEEARIWSVAHPDETKAITAKRLNLTGSYLAKIWPDHQFTLSLDQSLLLAMNDEARWMVINNLTTERTLPDFHALIYTSGLEKIKPDSVNIVR